MSVQTRRRKAIIGGVAAVTLIGLSGGTLAQMQASAVSDDQRINSGTASLAITGPGGGVEFDETIRNLAAGDSVVQYADVVNTGTLDLVDLAASQQSSGALVADALGLDVTIASCTVAWSAVGTCAGTAADLYASDLSVWGASVVDLAGLDLTAGSTAHLRFATHLDSSAPNSLQAQGAVITYKIDAVQGGAGGTAPAPVTRPTTWSSDTASLSERRSGNSTAVVDGTLYSIGGRSPASRYVTTVEAYNSATNTWSAVAPLPVGSYLSATAVVDGLIYVFGGDDGDYMSGVYAYDPVTNVWTQKASMPDSRFGGSASVVDGIVYVVGGSTYYDATTDVVAYDPTTNSWTSKAPIPTARHFTSTSVVDGLIYAIGGSSQGPIASVEAYNPVTNTWTQKAPLPMARYGLGTAVVGNTIYAIGGTGGQDAGSLVETYDVATNAWTTQAPMPVIRSTAGTSVLGGAIYVVGGLGPNGMLSSVSKMS